MNIIQISQVETITVNRPDSNFDKACDMAYWLALSRFSIDEYGHSTKLSEWERKCCWVEMDFQSYKRIGEEHIYVFTATAKKDIED